MIKILETRLAELVEYKVSAHKAHDYETCMLLKGAIIELEKLIKENK